MKRLQPDDKIFLNDPIRTLDSPEQLFPNDIWLNIARQSNWLLSGPIAICSKSLLLMFLAPSTLVEIIGDIKKDLRNRMLKWLTFDFPAEYMIFPPGFDHKKIYESLEYKPQSRHEFITGGYITQKIYDLNWESDIDIYCHNGTYDNCCGSHRIKNIDRISSTTLRLEQVIENFDMSIVQQGYLHDKYYLTPLALYTFHTKDIIICPSNLNIEYRVPEQVLKNNHQLHQYDGIESYSKSGYHTIKRDIWYYIHKHIHYSDNEYRSDDDDDDGDTKDIHTGSFDQCCKCWKYFCYDSIEKWIIRVKKYRNRFPEFTFTYCRPTTIHDIYDDYSHLTDAENRGEIKMNEDESEEEEEECDYSIGGEDEEEK